MGERLFKGWTFPSGSMQFFRLGIALPLALCIFTLIMWWIVGFQLVCIQIMLVIWIPSLIYGIFVYRQSGCQITLFDDKVMLRYTAISYRIPFPIQIPKTLTIPMDQIKMVSPNIFRNDVRVFVGKKKIWGNELLTNEELIAGFTGENIHIGSLKSKKKISKNDLMMLIFECTHCGQRSYTEG